MVIRGSYIITGVRNENLWHIIRTLNLAKELKMNEPDFLDIMRISRKQDNPVTEVKHTSGYRDKLPFAHGVDRTFPLETVELKSFNQKHDKDIENAIIHIGSDADYYARRMNLLAFVLNDHIYFRSNKFNTTTDEGRKLVAHELTHVAQNKERRFEGKDELEREAEQTEYAEVEETDPKETFTVNGKFYQLRKSEQKKFVHITADNITKWLEERKIILDEVKYLELLVAYKEFITGIEPLGEPITQADRRLDEELKIELKFRAGIL
ncbi:MAG: DUF4157 domain-containing protein [Treponema sp.]|jgi:hypothetical protein|nr:DUF4157 domain-containing protein [Treponema sp.]